MHVPQSHPSVGGRGAPQPTRASAADLAKNAAPSSQVTSCSPPPSPPSIDAEENNHDHGAADEYTPHAPLAQAPSFEQHEPSDPYGGQPR